MEILAHRYLLRGKNKLVENSLSQLKEAINFVNFFETDIRRLASGEFYISHDPQTIITPENDARLHLSLWEAHGCKVALNIKERDHEQDLVDFLKQHHGISRVFLFDYDIGFLGAELQKYIDFIHSLAPELECAVRVSDHNESIERALGITNSTIIWLDEFDSLWANEDHIRTLKSAGRKVYCIAPDLHGFSEPEILQRFNDFINWDVEGICTDHPLLLKQILAESKHD